MDNNDLEFEKQCKRAENVIWFFFATIQISVLIAIILGVTGTVDFFTGCEPDCNFGKY